MLASLTRAEVRSGDVLLDVEVEDECTRVAAILEQRGDNFTMAPEVRGLVQANVLNLFDPWPMRHKYDAIFCRNVMIYFDDKAKAELISRLVDLLQPGGYLFIGHSERLVGEGARVMQRSAQTCFMKPHDCVA